MDATSKYRIQTYVVLTLIGIGYGFYSGWNMASVTFSIIFGCLLVSESLANYLAGVGQNARKQIRRMSPSELEDYLETLSPQKRQKFVSDLLAVGGSDSEYIAALTAEERSRYDTLLEKLKVEQSRGRA